MKRSENRILTTHVGSLIRPKALLDAGKDHAHGPAYQQELKRVVVDVVAKQAAAGIDIVNDGEYGKSGWANYSLERLTGFEPRPDKLYEAVWLGRDRIRFAEFMKAEFPRGAIGTPGHGCAGPKARSGELPAVGFQSQIKNLSPRAVDQQSKILSTPSLNRCPRALCYHSSPCTSILPN